MALAKARKMNPRQLATDVLAKLGVSEICEKVEIAGAGFLNFRLKNAMLAQTLEAAARGEHLFYDRAVLPRTPCASLKYQRHWSSLLPRSTVSPVSSRKLGWYA